MHSNGGEKIKTRINFEQEAFIYQDWPYEEIVDDLPVHHPGEREDSVLGRPAEDGTEAQIMDEPEVARDIVPEVQADHDKWGQTTAESQVRDLHEKVIVESHVSDGRGQVVVDLTPHNQDDLEAIKKTQSDHLGDQKRVNGDVGKVAPATNAANVSEPTVVPPGPKRRKKFSRVLRRLGLWI